MDCFKKLNLSIPWLNPDYDLAADQRRYQIFPIHKIFQLNLDALNPELIDWFKEKQIDIKAFIFLTPPMKTSLIHIDGNTFHDYWALNWAWGCDEHQMSWWKPLNKTIPAVNNTQASTSYRAWTEDEVTKIASTKIDVPTICRIGVPHRAENPSDTVRWSISIRPKEFTPWAVAMDVFKNEITEQT